MRKELLSPSQENLAMTTKTLIISLKPPSHLQLHSPEMLLKLLLESQSSTTVSDMTKMCTVEQNEPRHEISNILTSVDSDEPLHPPFKLNSK